MSERVNLYALVTEGLRPTARGTIYTIFAVEQLSSQARLTLDGLSLLDPDEIPEYLLEGLYHGSTNNFPGLLTMSEFQSARGELISRSLINQNVDGKKVWIHRL